MLIGVEIVAVCPSMFPLYESWTMESLIQVKKENYLIGFLKILNHRYPEDQIAREIKRSRRSLS